MKTEEECDRLSRFQKHMQYFMRKITFLLLSLFLVYDMTAQSLSGTVIDFASHLTLAGVSVYLPGLKIGAITDIKGNYRIAPIPKGNYIMSLQMTGYATITRQINIQSDTLINFDLIPVPATLKEVMITSLGNATTIRRAPVPVTLVSHDMLIQQSSTNVIDAISRLPGISQITEGPGISKPQINGLGYNRVLTLLDGIRQEDFQWGDEHGILIDPYAVYDAEIIRGAASLQYGANAMAGVISFSSQPFPEKGLIQGTVQSEYQSNNGLLGNEVDIRGNLNGFIWDLQGSFSAAHCYSDLHDGYVWGTAFQQSNIRAVLGLKKNWGSSRLTISLLHRQIEVPDGNRDSTTRQFEFDTPQNGKIYPSLENFLSYDPDIAGYQILDHDEVFWQNNINAGKGKIQADIGFTQSIRHEIDTGLVGEENMIVHDIPYAFKYRAENSQTGLKYIAGINGMYEFENNYAEPPAPYIGDFEIPNYHLFDIGGFAILQKDHKNLSVSGGIRYEIRTITGQPMYLSDYNLPTQKQVPQGTPGAYTQFNPFNNTYTGFSGSLGASYQLAGHSYLKLNIAKSYRAPAINELTSNELNGGSSAYDLGNTGLKAEQGYELDFSYGIDGQDFHAEMGGFYNHINHFIFADRLGSSTGGDSILLGFPVFQFVANTANIEGITAVLHIHPSNAKWFEWVNGFSIIHTLMPGQTDSTQHVPFTPAPRLTSTIRFNFQNMLVNCMRGAYIAFGAEHDWPQREIYSELHTELPSVAYTLYHADIGAGIVNRKSKRIIYSVFISGTNLTNLSYASHSSRVQYFWAFQGVPNTATRQSQGIYNMGRNFCVKLIVPIGNGSKDNLGKHETVYRNP